MINILKVMADNRLDAIVHKTVEHLVAERNPILDRGWEAALGHDFDHDD